MRISTITYIFRQGFKNIWTNLIFSLASILTMGACIFLFGIFFALVTNFSYMVNSAEKNVSMTVLFDEDIDQARIEEIGEEIRAMKGVDSCKYISAEAAWDSFRDSYFPSEQQEVAEGFKDNPLANSANYEVFVSDVSLQEELVEKIGALKGVRQVNHSEEATSALTTLNRIISYVSASIIIVLLIVAVFLIYNTISVGISVRREEISIMKLIGATNHIVRAPFLIEGVILGLVGSAIPLVLVYFLYNTAATSLQTQFSKLSSLIQFLPAGEVFRVLLPVSLALGVGIGLIGSLITIRKHLKV